MTQLEMMIVRRGTEQGVRDFLVPDHEVSVGDTIVMTGTTGRVGHRLGFRHETQPRGELGDGTVIECRGQRCRLEDGMAVPLANPEHPYGSIISEGAMKIADDEPVRVMLLRPVSRVTGPIR